MSKIHIWMEPNAEPNTKPNTKPNAEPNAESNAETKTGDNSISQLAKEIDIIRELEKINNLETVSNHSVDDIISNRKKTHVGFQLFNQTKITNVIVNDYMELYKFLKYENDYKKSIGSIELIDNDFCKWHITIFDIVIELSLHPIKYPTQPPTIQILSPIFADDLNSRISRSKYTNIDYWVCSRTPTDIIKRTLRIINKYGKIQHSCQQNQKPINMKQDTLDHYKKFQSLLNTLDFLDLKNSEVIDSDMTFVKTLDLIKNKNKMKNNEEQIEHNRTYAKGTGYSTENSPEWDLTEYHLTKAETTTLIVNILEKLIDQIYLMLELENGDISFTVDDVKRSGFYRYMVSHFRDISMLEITGNLDFYRILFSFIQQYCLQNTLILFYDEDPQKSLYASICRLFREALSCLDLDPTNINAEMICVIHSMIDEPYQQYVLSIQTESKNVEQNKTITDLIKTDEIEQYKMLLDPHRFTITSGLSSESDYRFLKNVNSESTDQLRNCYARLSSEIPTLKECTSVSPYSLLMFNIDRQRYNCIRCIMSGPKDTPYALGLYVFDIYCSSKYPMSPPEIMLVNIGSSKNRLNPNLYTSGCICMSILNTYSGSTPYAAEKWNPSISTLSQIIISIQANIFTSEPYFNEASHMSTYGTLQGKIASDDYNNQVKYGIILAGMKDPISMALKNRLAPFSQVILAHFRLLKNKIKSQCLDWINNGGQWMGNISDAYQELLTVLDPL